MTDTHRIEIQVDSRTAVDASRNLGLLTGSVNNAERSIGGMRGALSGLQGSLGSIDRATNMTSQAMSSMASSMTRIEQQLVRVSSEARNASNSFGGLNTMLGAFGVATGIAGVALLTKNIIKLNMEMESLRARLDMILPSLSAAKDAFALITKIAAETPQSIQEITKAFLLLRNSGLSTSEADLRGWTNMAAKFGTQADDLTGVIRQFGQAMMKGKLQAQDTNAMIERGIPVYALLKETMGKSAAEILKMAEAGEIGTKEMEKFKERLFEISDGSSAKAMDTLRGKIEGLGSAWTGFVDNLMGDKSEGMLKNMVGLLTATLEHLAKLMDNSIDAQIKTIESKLLNPPKSFISKGLIGAGFIDSESELKEQLNSLKALKQKGIDDNAKMDKLAREQKQAEELKI